MIGVNKLVVWTERSLLSRLPLSKNRKEGAMYNIQISPTEKAENSGCKKSTNHRNSVLLAHDHGRRQSLPPIVGHSRLHMEGSLVSGLPIMAVEHS